MHARTTSAFPIIAAQNRSNRAPLANSTVAMSGPAHVRCSAECRLEVSATPIPSRVDQLWFLGKHLLDLVQIRVRGAHEFFHELETERRRLLLWLARPREQAACSVR